MVDCLQAEARASIGKRTEKQSHLLEAALTQVSDLSLLTD